jgi:hypothetical protein
MIGGEAVDEEDRDALAADLVMDRHVAHDRTPYQRAPVPRRRCQPA